MFLAKINNMKH